MEVNVILSLYLVLLTHLCQGWGESESLNNNHWIHFTMSDGVRRCSSLLEALHRLEESSIPTYDTVCSTWLLSTESLVITTAAILCTLTCKLTTGTHSIVCNLNS